MTNKTIDEHKQVELPDLNQQNNPNQTSQNRLEGIFQLLNNIIKTTRDFIIKDNFFVDDSEIRLNAGQRFKRTNFNTLITGSVYSVTRADYLIGVINLSYAPTVGLPMPSVVGSGKNYIIKDEAGGAATTSITIRSYENITIDGAASTTIAINYGIRSFYTDGKQWFAGLD